MLLLTARWVFLRRFRILSHSIVLFLRGSDARQGRPVLQLELHHEDCGQTFLLDVLLNLLAPAVHRIRSAAAAALSEVGVDNALLYIVVWECRC